MRGGGRGRGISIGRGFLVRKGVVGREEREEGGGDSSACRKEEGGDVLSLFILFSLRFLFRGM